jgi:hypothetical protein
MRYRLAISSGLVFAITWPRLYNPVARSCVTFSLRSGSLSPAFAHQSCPRTMSSLSYALLQQQSAETSNALMDHWLGSADFQKLATSEGNMTVARDIEDGEKLQIGIDYAKEKGVIDPDFVPEPYVKIDVLGKTPDQVASEIIETVQKKQSEGGSVIVLCGLSGTGKARPLIEKYYYYCVVKNVHSHWIVSSIFIIFRGRRWLSCDKSWRRTRANRSSLGPMVTFLGASPCCPPPGASKTDATGLMPTRHSPRKTLPIS